MSETVPPKGNASAGKIVGLVGCGCLGMALVGAAVIGFIVWGAGKAMKSAEPYRDSIAAIEGNAAAAEALGTPVKPGFLPSGSFNVDNGVSTVDFSIPVSGPKGKGTIRVVASKASDSAPWTYETWQLDVEGGGSIPLGR